jgi:imidazolonepropionase-like amidohydrolase
MEKNNIQNGRSGKNEEMKKILLQFSLLCSLMAAAQENIHPAPAQSATIALVNGVIHVGNGQVIENGMIVFSGGKIVDVRPTATIMDVKVIDLKGKHVYPGIIAACSNLGLIEIDAVHATEDVQELGEFNPSMRSLVAYNADSKIINTIRSNGILLANIVPDGGILSGSSSVVQLDAWDWEDAAYNKDNGIHFRMPSLRYEPRQPASTNPQADRLKQNFARIESVRKFLREARAYNSETIHIATNLKFAAVKGLFDQSKAFFVHCELVNEMMIAIDMAKEFHFRLVLVGAGDCWLMTDVLKQNHVTVILEEPHALPKTDYDDVSQPYKTGAELQAAGILFTIYQDNDMSYTRQRNLPFEAGTMAAYGLTKEQALSAITLNAAKILGIDNMTGSLEIGKDANIVVSEGDLLDMRSSKVTLAYIQGREINLDNKQTQLFEKYKYKYGIK